MPRRYTLMVVDDDTLLTPETLKAHFTTRADGATLELFGDQVFTSAAAALNRAKQPNPPDVILLDNYYKVGDDKEPRPLALLFMVSLSQEFSRREEPVPVPLCILHTQREVTPLMAYSFRAAGGHHIIDKADMSDFAERIKRVWEVIDGERWTPEQQPAQPELGELEARVLACLQEPLMAEKNPEIAAYLFGDGDKPNAKKVSGARSRLVEKILELEPGERANGRAAEILARAIDGGHVWVPIAYREAVFKNREVALPFDAPPVLDTQEPPLR